MSIELKNMKIAKTGSKRVIIIPSKLIKHKMFDPELRYDVIFNPIIINKQEEEIIK